MNGAGSRLRRVRLIMLLEAVLFATAALIHSGGLVAGYEHDGARIAESVIAGVLLLGAVLTWVRALGRRAAVGAQAFALLGTCVGVLTIVIGVGPRTVPDVIYHLAMVVVLVFGLRMAWRVASVD